MRTPKRHYRHMTRVKAEEIRRLYFARGATQADIAWLYGIKQGSVSRIISYQVWASL